MRKLALLTIAAAAVVALGHGIALAQGVGIGVYGGPYYGAYYYDDDYVRPGPRVYGYYRDDDDDVVIAPRTIRPADCGEYHYWNGAYCADARVNPPDLR
jgi:hypothetical protein